MLRYLADAYKALRQTVPEAARTEALADLIAWLGELVRQVDSSLLEEWERLRNPGPETASRGRLADRPPPVTATCGPSGCWCATRCSAGWSWPRAAAGPSWASWTASGWSTEDVAERPGALLRRAGGLQTGADARGPELLIIDERAEAGSWGVRQILDDPAGDHDWGITARIDLARATPRAPPWSRSPTSVSWGSG